MAAPPASTKTSLQQRLSARARERWPELAGVDVKFRGAFAYVTGRLKDGDTHTADAAAVRRISRPLGLRDLPGQQGRLRRLRPAHRRFAGAPEDALDTACGLYLGDPTAWI